MQKALKEQRDIWDLVLAIFSVLAIHLVGIAAGHGAMLLFMLYLFVFKEPAAIFPLVPLLLFSWLLIWSARGSRAFPSTKRIISAHLIGTAICITAYIRSEPPGKWLALYSSVPWIVLAVIRLIRLAIILKLNSRRVANYRLHT